MAARGTDSDGGSMTPSERSDDDRSEHDSDYETDEDEEEESSDNLNIVWTGYGKKNPVIIFKVEAIMNKKTDVKTVGERYHMAYKFANTECKIIRNILQTHGFHEIHPNSSDYNIVWSNGHLKPFTLRSMSEFQKINHFPRSYELTRKDRLFKNIQRMQQLKGYKHFDFIPQSYVLPGEYQDFCAMFVKDKGPYIVKPVASSRGRGVFLVNHPDQVPLDENVIVCKYIANPLLIDGFKFDVRLYVAVTSYDPLTIYLYEEGLTRFATVKYEKTNKSIRNQCMHLTNYSVNKKSQDYVRNDDPEIEDYGNKWSLGALLRYLRAEGKDTAALMMRVEDVIIKTIISVELPIATACKMFMPHRGNCFELYGFDVLIDDQLKPWIVEVNLSPSLACDSPLDLKIKGNMLCDLFSLTGISCHDPMVKTIQQSRRNQDIASKLASRAKSARVRPLSASSQKRPLSANSTLTAGKKENRNPALVGLSGEEIKILRRVKEEEPRRRGWVRIFPSADSWDTHSQYLQFNTTHNLMVHQRLFPERHKVGSKAGVNLTSTGQRARNSYLQITGGGSHTKLDPTRSVEAYTQALIRMRQYERRLGPRKKRKGKKKGRKMDRRMKLVQGIAEDLQEEGEEQSDTELSPIVDPLPVMAEPNPLMNKPKLKPDRPVAVKQEVIVESKPQRPEKEEVIIVSDPEKVTVKKVTYTEVPAPTGAVARFEEKPVSVPVEEPHNAPAPSAPLPPPPQYHPQSQSQSKPPPEPKYNVVELLNKGRTLSKVQARSAFAMYLVRVQDRLLSESTVLSQEAVEALNEQMDLVLRFLKRAAVNLQQSFKVVVPSRKLHLSDRRRILAKQLGDFVHIYNKETEQLKSRQDIDKKLFNRGEGNTEGLNEEQFDKFVRTVSESELEDVLTTYTRINKSASIFLGSNSKTNVDAAQPSSSSSTSIGGATESLGRRKTSMSEGDNGIAAWEDVPRIRSSSSHTDVRTGGYSSSCSRPLSAKNTYNGAVSIYSQRLSRPRSASTGNVTKGKSPSNRPVSAAVARPPPTSFAPTEPTVDTYNEEAIQDALQRLALRQQARQYAALNGSCILSQETVISRPPSGHHGNRPISANSVQSGADNPATTANTNRTNPVRCTEGQHQPQQTFPTKTASVHYASEEDCINAAPNYKRPESHVSSKPPSSASHGRHSIHQRNANTTFNTFIEETGQARDIANAYNQITGNAHYSTAGYHNSRQLQFAQQQMHKQQRLMEQSKALLEQSRAKHQAMVAQAHAAQRTLSGRHSDKLRSINNIQNDRMKPRISGNQSEACDRLKFRTSSGQSDQPLSLSEHSKPKSGIEKLSNNSKYKSLNTLNDDQPKTVDSNSIDQSKPKVLSGQQSDQSKPKKVIFDQQNDQSKPKALSGQQNDQSKQKLIRENSNSRTNEEQSKNKLDKTQSSESVQVDRKHDRNLQKSAKSNQPNYMENEDVGTKHDRIRRRTIEAAMAESNQGQVQGENGFTPKPPEHPSAYKKLPSSYRIARTNAAADEKGINFDFYNSLKYDVHTGQTRSRGGDNW